MYEQETKVDLTIELTREELERIPIRFLAVLALEKYQRQLRRQAHKSDIINTLKAEETNTNLSRLGRTPSHP